MTREQFIQHVEGNQKAFRRFLAALCCGDSALADDIAQEALIKAYLSSDGFQSPEKFNAWIYRIGYNCFLNHRRTLRPSVSYDRALEVPAEGRADNEELYAALNRLSEKERTALLLFYMEGYAVKEIAEILATSVDAVKQLLSRGRTHLKEKYGRERD